MTEFPIGATLDHGAWTLTECLAGEPARGRYRARGRDGASALVTLAHYQRGPVDLDHYAMRAPRIATLRHVGRLEPPLGRYDGLVEDEPAGAVLADLPAPPLDVALAIVIDGCELVDAAHAAGIVLRGLRPELIYVDGPRITGVAPRCEEFMATSTPPSSGVLHPFLRYYLAPEILRLQPVTPAADVFSLGAILGELATGEHPFEGEHILDQLYAVTGNARRPWRGPDPLRAIVDRAVAPDPGRRPSAGELHAQLLHARMAMGLEHPVQRS